jgi:hypothetical protein
MPLFSPSRCVLLISDDGASIYDVTGSRTSLIDTIPWATEDFETSVQQVIRRRCRGKPVLILNDMVEQHYRKERVPRINFFDKGNVVKRRLAAAFPSYPVRAGLKLKEKGIASGGAEKGDGDVYLFTAVPVSESVSKTFNVIRSLSSPITGFTLLPVESASMVHALSKKLSKSSGSQSMWTVFVGQHRSGGLRQVVTRNGELALTRITPIIDSDDEPQAWAADVASELKGTMSYLARFGYDPTDGLDVIVIANHSAKDEVVALIDFECNLTLMTTSEAANLLDMKIGRQEEQRYADVLHVTWAGRKSSMVLPLQAGVLDQITAPAKRANAVAFVLFCVCAYIAFITYQEAATWTKLRSDLTDAKKMLSDVSVEHAAELERNKAAGVDFVLIDNATRLYETFESGSMKPLSVIDIIGKSLDPDLHISSLSIKPMLKPNTDEDTYFQDAANVMDSAISDRPKPPAKQFEIIVKILFPGELGPEKGISETSAYEARLKRNLPDHEVAILKQVADLSYTGNFVGEATQQKTNKTVEDFDAQIVIRGALE